jgi:hypothetical protein
MVWNRRIALSRCSAPKPPPFAVMAAGKRGDSGVDVDRLLQKEP